MESKVSSNLQHLVDIQRATTVAKRLLGLSMGGKGTYVNVQALEDIGAGSLVSMDINCRVKEMSAGDKYSGMAVGTIKKGEYGWVQSM